jgi:hypothetical protein
MNNGERTATAASATPATAALLVPGALFCANYVMRNAQPFAGERVAYFLVVTLAFGTLLPLWTLGWLSRVHGMQLGFASQRFRLLKLALATVCGGLLCVAALGPRIVAELDHALHLFAWVFTMSVVQTLVFLGIVYNVVCTTVARSAPRWFAVVTATVFASLAFGLFHFSYGPPWNSWEVVARVGVVWLLVTAVFLVTGEFWAAVLFDTLLAVVGFMLRGIGELDREPLALGIAMDATLIALTLLLSRRWLRTHERACAAGLRDGAARLAPAELSDARR